jgi:hypothetical protein
MTSATASVTVTTEDIELPAGAVPLDYQIAVLNASGAIVLSWTAPSLNPPPPPFNVSALPSGAYMMRAERRGAGGVVIGIPATQAFDLSQTVTVPKTVTVALA